MTYYKISIIIMLVFIKNYLSLIIMIMKVINFKHDKNPFSNYFVLSCYKNIDTSKKKEGGNE